MLGKERLKQWAEQVQPAGGLSPANQQRQKAFAFCEGGLSPIARAGLHSAVEMGRLDVYLLCYEIPEALPRGVYAVECQSLLARGMFDNAIVAGISSSFVGDLICARAVSKDSGWIISPSAIWLRPAPCPTTETFMHGHMFGSMAACPHVDVCPFKKSASEDTVGHQAVAIELLGEARRRAIVGETVAASTKIACVGRFYLGGRAANRGGKVS